VNGYVVDTTVWIDFSNGNDAASRFLANARSKGRVTCSVINMMEVLIGAIDTKHQRALEAVFKCYEVLPITEEDGWQATRIVKAKARSSGIGVADALIAAVAMREGLVVATHNLRDFATIPGLKVIKPY